MVSNYAACAALAGGCAEARCGGMVRLPAVFPPAAGRLAMSSGGGGLRIAAVIISGASIDGQQGAQDMGRSAWGDRCSAWGDRCLVRGVWSTSNPSAAHAASLRLRPREGRQTSAEAR